MAIIGRRLAQALERDFQVKLIEYNKKACERLAAELTHTLVLCGDGTDENLLAPEHIADDGVGWVFHALR